MLQCIFSLDFFIYKGIVLKNINVKIKKLVPEATIPTYAHITDAGCDMVAISMLETEKYVQYGTGIALELPENWYAEIFSRSSISKYDLILANSVGVIDNSYRGEILFRFKKSDGWNRDNFYKVGDKIGQLILKQRPLINFIEIDKLSETERGTGSYGSTGH